MTSFPLGVLIVVTAAQVPGSMPAAPESAGPAPVIIRIDELPETVGTRPFKKIFTVSEDAIRKAQAHPRAEAQSPPTGARPRVVCGMKVIEVDPQIDPKMIHRSADSSTTHHIKRIPPATCAE
jgi:hypothetical protein